MPLGIDPMQSTFGRESLHAIAQLRFQAWHVIEHAPDIFQANEIRSDGKPSTLRKGLVVNLAHAPRPFTAGVGKRRPVDRQPPSRVGGTPVETSAEALREHALFID